MLIRGWGRIINISSVNGQKGAFGQTNYSAAKAGHAQFHQRRWRWKSRAKGVTVNTISPGYIGTQDGHGDPAGRSTARSSRRSLMGVWANRKRSLVCRLPGERGSRIPDRCQYRD